MNSKAQRIFPRETPSSPERGEWDRLKDEQWEQATLRTAAQGGPLAELSCLVRWLQDDVDVIQSRVRQVRRLQKQIEALRKGGA